MREFSKLAVAAFTAFLTFAGTAQADDPDFIAVGAGWYDWNDDRDAVDFRIEYRSGYKMLGIMKPWLGLEVTTDSALYATAGILMDVYFGRRWVFTPSFGAGYYKDGNGKDLGHDIEFRSQLELGYRFDNRSRISFAISHISNASLSDNNPGTEIATIYYHIPISDVFVD